MQMRELVTQVVAERVKEYFADSPVGTSPRPVIRPPAEPGALAELEHRSTQSLEAGYREFLLLTDGLEGFPSCCSAAATGSPEEWARPLRNSGGRSWTASRRMWVYLREHSCFR